MVPRNLCGLVTNEMYYLNNNIDWIILRPGGGLSSLTRFKRKQIFSDCVTMFFHQALYVIATTSLIFSETSETSGTDELSDKLG